MRNLKKVLSLVLAMVMVLSMMVTANAAFADQDKINPDYSEAVTVMAELNILLGTENADGTFSFNPTGTLTRDAAAKILAVVHSGEYEESYFVGQTKYVSNPFTDVKGWAAPYVLYGYANEIIGGTSATTYSGSKELKGYEFAKMLLVAAGFGKHADYVDDDTQTWKMKTLAAAKNAKLLTGLDINLDEVISREEASQMALNAMIATDNTGYWYVVPSTNVGNSTADYVGQHTDMTDAYIMSAILNAGDEGAFKVVYNYDTSKSLLTKNFDTTFAPGQDDFGRPSTVYTFNVDEVDEYELPFPYAAAKTYTAATKATVVAADLKGTKMAGVEDDAVGYYSIARDSVDSWSVTVTVDGEDDTRVFPMDDEDYTTPAALIASYTGANTAVEVYTDEKGIITELVVINTYVDQIVDTHEGDLEVYDYPTATLAHGGEFINLAGFEKYDVVTFTMASGNPVGVALATNSFVGTVSSYTNKNAYTINGSVYALDGYAYTDSELKVDLIEASVVEADELVYYPGVDGTILYATNVDGEAPVVYTDYAYVLNTKVYVASPATGGIYGDKPTYAAEIEVLLADGSTDVWTVPVSYTTKAIAAYEIPANTYYTVVAKTPYDLTADPDVDLNDGPLNVLQNNVYTYTDETLVAAVPTMGAEAMAGKNGAVVNDVTGVTGTTLATEDGIILNDKTVFIVDGPEDGVNYTVVTGVKNLGEDAVNGTVVATQTYIAATKTTPEAYVRVATLVFAPSSELTDDEPEVDVKNLVLSDGTYVVTYDAKGVAHYTYTVVNAKGESVEVEGDGLITEGIWALATNGKLISEDEYAKTVGGDVVIGVYGTTVVLKASAPIAVDSTVVVVDLVGDGLVVGSEIVYTTGLVYIVG